MKRLLWTMPVALMLALPGCGGPAPAPKKAPPPKDEHDHDHKDGDHDHKDEKGKVEKKDADKGEVKGTKDDDAPKDPLEKFEK